MEDPRRAVSLFQPLKRFRKKDAHGFGYKVLSEELLHIDGVEVAEIPDRVPLCMIED
jgi:hypothetical protein